MKFHVGDIVKYKRGYCHYVVEGTPNVSVIQLSTIKESQSSSVRHRYFGHPSNLELVTKKETGMRIEDCKVGMKLTVDYGEDVFVITGVGEKMILVRKNGSYERVGDPESYTLAPKQKKKLYQWAYTTDKGRRWFLLGQLFETVEQAKAYLGTNATVKCTDNMVIEVDANYE